MEFAAPVPWGLDAREFIVLVLAFSALFLAALVTIVCTIVNAWRDRGVAKFQAQPVRRPNRAPTAASTLNPLPPHRHPPPQRSSVRTDSRPIASLSGADNLAERPDHDAHRTKLDMNPSKDR